MELFVLTLVFGFVWVVGWVVVFAWGERTLFKNWSWARVGKVLMGALLLLLSAFCATVFGGGPDSLPWP